MRREQLEHVIRAAASITNDDDSVIVGSQAVLGRYLDPAAHLRIKSVIRRMENGS